MDTFKGGVLEVALCGDVFECEKEEHDNILLVAYGRHLHVHPQFLGCKTNEKKVSVG